MKALAVCSALLLAVPTVAAPIPKGAQSANLIVNGSFEDAKDEDASRPQDKGSTPRCPQPRTVSAGRFSTM